jgi:hypothetical protein
MNPLIRISTILFACIAVSGCDPESAESAGRAPQYGTPITVITSNYPLYYFAGQITSGMHGEVEIILPEMEGDPANWQPDSKAITLLQGSDLLVLNGAGYESWLGWVTVPEDLLLDTGSSRSKTKRCISMVPRANIPTRDMPLPCGWTRNSPLSNPVQSTRR